MTIAYLRQRGFLTPITTRQSNDHQTREFCKRVKGYADPRPWRASRCSPCSIVPLKEVRRLIFPSELRHSHEGKTQIDARIVCKRARRKTIARHIDACRRLASKD